MSEHTEYVYSVLANCSDHKLDVKIKSVEFMVVIFKFEYKTYVMISFTDGLSIS